MIESPKLTPHQEREFLYEVGTSLNSALFIVDRLIEEIKEEEGRLEIDVETEKRFLHLSNCLNQMNKLIKSHSNLVSDLIDEELRLEKAKRLAQIQPLKRKPNAKIKGKLQLGK